MSAGRAARRLRRLLEEERRLLRAGDFAALAALIPRMSAAVEAVSGAPRPPDAASATALRAEAERNRRLLAAALAGFAAARDELERGRAARTRLGYGADGRPVRLRPEGPARRA